MRWPRACFRQLHWPHCLLMYLHLHHRALQPWLPRGYRGATVQPSRLLALATQHPALARSTLGCLAHPLSCLFRHQNRLCHRWGWTAHRQSRPCCPARGGQHLLAQKMLAWRRVLAAGLPHPAAAASCRRDRVAVPAMRQQTHSGAGLPLRSLPPAELLLKPCRRQRCQPSPRKSQTRQIDAVAQQKGHQILQWPLRGARLEQALQPLLQSCHQTGLPLQARRPTTIPCTHHR